MQRCRHHVFLFHLFNPRSLWCVNALYEAASTDPEPKSKQEEVLAADLEDSADLVASVHFLQEQQRSATAAACSPANLLEAAGSLLVLPLPSDPAERSRIQRKLPAVQHHQSKLLKTLHSAVCMLYCLVDVLVVLFVWLETMAVLDLLNPWLSVQVLVVPWVLLSASFASWLSVGNAGWRKWLDSFGTVRIYLSLLLPEPVSCPSSWTGLLACVS